MTGLSSQRKKDLLAAVIFILLSHLAGVIGSIFTAGAVADWYPQLEKPAYTPPGWLFGPVWLTLYTLMGIAASLVWRTGLRRPLVKLAVAVFFFQLALNASWSIAFFGFRSPLAGLVVIILLWLAIIDTTFLFYLVRPAAAALMIPYFLWATFAAILNLRIWQFNP